MSSPALARRVVARVALFAGCVAVLAVPSRAAAQYFGQNKVNYETFNFRTLQTPHFDILYYPTEATASADAARMAERWYARFSPFFRHQFTERKTVILFADPADFQQNNVTEIEGEGTGGVTESFRQRVVMPHTGSYFDTHHVLGHELVHVFQYDIAEKQASAPGSGRSIGLNGLPLWLVEGMAEYLSLGRDDSNTSMWLRDAARRNDIPTIKQLTTDPKYFPYRYGQALWAYVGGRYGDQAVVDVYRSSLRYGFEGAIRRVLDVSTDQLSKDWAAAIKDAYLPLLSGRTAPDSTATLVTTHCLKRGCDYNVSPSISPDGRRVAFFSTRDLFGIEIYVADVETGRIVKKLGSVNSPRHYDALSFIQTAGSWSPDGRQLAYVVYEKGNQMIRIYDADGGHDVRTLNTKGIGAASDPAWSPDGKTIAFSGMVGGVSDLYLYDLSANTYERVTNSREAELQPAWSPDGKTIAFVTDRGDGTNLDQLTFGPMRLATMDLASRQIRLLPVPAPGAKSINPNFSPDGQSIYFVSDRTGFNDVYRMDLASGALSQVTKVQTGVLGVTSLSPALSVARNTGRVVFSIFDRQGNAILRLDGDATRGTPVPNAVAGAAAAPDTSRAVTAAPTNPAAPSAGATNTTGTTQPQPAAPGGRLPPFAPRYTSAIESYLADATTGLTTTTAEYAQRPYNAGLHLDYIAPPTFGVQTGGFYGTQFGGGVAFGFSDQVGNQNLVTILQAQGDIQDIGGEVLYTNLKHRWNYAGLVARIPYLAAYQTAPYLDQNVQAYAIDQGIQRLYLDQIGGILQYPLSTTRRLEAGITGTRQSYRVDVYTYYLNSFGQVIGQARQRLPNCSSNAEQLTGGCVPKPLYYTQGNFGLVGDYSIFGFTSPIAGSRYRFDVDPTVGQIQMTTAIADWRRYWLARPVTFAIRGLHYGRYGRDAQNDTILYPIYLGNPQFVRGYDYNSIDPSECKTTTPNSSACPIFDRLLGSRIAVASAELRIPLLGVEGLGLIHTNLLPVEIAPFVDAGVAWRSDAPAKLRFVTGAEARTTTDRIPVVSAGLTARINLFGYAVLETYYAKAFQRPDKKPHFGFQLAPGW